MRHFLAPFLAALLATAANAQTVPFGPIKQGQVWTPSQWNAAWASKTDYSGAIPVLPLRIESFGGTANPITLYVNSSGSDSGGTNVCALPATPCLTWQHAVNEAQKFDAEGGNIIVHDSDMSPHNFAESISVTNPMRGAGSGFAVPNIGTTDSGQIILDGNSEATITGGGYCYGVAASNNAIVGVENITIAPTAYSCQDGLFAQLGGGINVYGGVTFGATGSNGYKVHAEDSAYGVEFWQNYTVTGNGAGFASVGAQGLVLISAGVGTVTGSPTVNEWVFVGNGGQFQTDIANPWGSSPGAITGQPFYVDGSGAIEPEGNAIAWPGTSPGNNGVLRGGGHYRGLGTAFTSTVSSPTGLGSGGTAALSPGSNAYAGTIILTAGSGASGNGNVLFKSPVLIQYSDGNLPTCNAFPTLYSSTTGQWQPGAVFQGSVTSTSAAGGTVFYWSNNSTNLTNGQVYAFGYTCPVDP